MKTEPAPFAAISDAERRILLACEVGEVADVADLPYAQRMVRPQLIRWLCENSSDRNLVSVRGIRVQGARIAGEIDLEGAELTVPLWLDRCQLDEINLRGATTHDVTLDESSFMNLDAERAHINGRLSLRRATVSGSIWLMDARLEGVFTATGTTFSTSDGEAIRGIGLHAAGWVMKDARVRGEVNLNATRLGRGFNADGAKFSNPRGFSIRAARATGELWSMNDAEVVGRLDLNGIVLTAQFNANKTTFENVGGVAISARASKPTRWVMRESRVLGRFDIGMAVLESQFSAQATIFRNPGGVAVSAQGVRCRGWSMSDACVYGELDINAATINGQFEASQAVFDNPGQKAIRAQGAVTGASWFMRDTKVKGRVELNSVEIAGQFVGSGSTFDNPGDVAIQANALTASDWMMTNATVHGQLTLASASLSGQFVGNETLFDNPGGVALHAQSVTAVGWLMRKAVINGTIVFDAADVFLLELTTTRLANKAGETSLRCINATFGRLRMPALPPRGGINLSRAVIDTLEDHRGGWLAGCSREPSDQPRSHLVLDGATYENLEFPDGDTPRNSRPRNRNQQLEVLSDHMDLVRDRSWFHVWWRNHRIDGGSEIWQRRTQWLMTQAADDLYGRFNPQPWKQLERTLVKMGYEQDARKVAVQRHVMQRRADRSRPRRALSLALHVLADYGFNPWKTVAWSLGLIGLCGAIFAVMAHCNWYCTPTGTTVGSFYAVGAGDVFSDLPAQPIYPDFNAWLYSLDLFIPILNLGMEQFWRPANGWIYLVTVFQQFLGAFLVGLTASGFAGLLTRDERS